MTQATRKRSAVTRRKKKTAASRSGSAPRGARSASSSKASKPPKAAPKKRADGGGIAVRAPTPRRELSKAEQKAWARRELDAADALGQVDRRLRGAAGIGCGFAALFALLSLLTFNVADPGWSHTGSDGAIHNSMGRAGAWFADVLLWLFGYMAYLVPLLLGVIAWLMLGTRNEATHKRGYRPFAFLRIVGIVLMLLTASGLADLHIGVPDGALPAGTFGGGVLGMRVAWPLMQMLNQLGTSLLLLALFLVALTLAFGTAWLALIEKLGAAVMGIGDSLRNGLGSVSEHRRERARVKAADRAREERQRDVQFSDPLLINPDLVDVPERQGLGAALEMIKSRAGTFAGAASAAGAAGAAAAAAHLNHDSNEARMDAEFDRALATRAHAEKGGAVALETPVGLPLGAGAAAKPASVATPVAPAVVPKPALRQASGAAGEGKEGIDAPVAKKKKIAIRQRAPEQHQSSLSFENGEGTLPPLSLLDTPEPQRPGFSEVELQSLSKLLEEKLAEFKIQVEVTAVQPGPVITRFEIALAPGIKASRITALSQDIARSMSLVSVRVVEVIAGKSTIGIEVPNEHREVVQLSELFRSQQWNGKDSVLTLALGKDISGQPVTADLGRMPHLLVAGTTGSGKSVGVNSMLISLLYKAKPADVRLILIDPKMLELNMYDGIPHLLTPVVTDMKEASNALRWCVGEMERRYQLMAELKVRNITGFNKKVREAMRNDTPIVDPFYDPERSLDPSGPPPTLEPLPFIVVVVDEFADMMMQVGKKAEELIARIAQKARASGIHLILATQRPSVDVITGLIKANIPTRIAFQVSQKVDSRTILDQQGAESLLGYGDMLYLPPGTGLPVRVHGAFVDDHEVHNVVSWIRQTGEPNYIEEILQDNAGGVIPGMGGGEDAGGEQDELYDTAVQIVLESGKASISYVQRRLKIGYNRAARLVEDMESAGLVSAPSHNGVREIIAPRSLD